MIRDVKFNLRANSKKTRPKRTAHQRLLSAAFVQIYATQIFATGWGLTGNMAEHGQDSTRSIHMSTRD